jgi:ABC-type phosphate/phosphonate transport system substrate-binding protein
MYSSQTKSLHLIHKTLLSTLLFTAFLVVLGTAVNGKQAALETLRIGASGTLTGKADDPKEKAGLKTLRRFIKEETGLNSDITGQMSWQTIAEKLSKGELHLAFFQGYEFAWAQEKYPDLRPLTIAVNVDRYPVACVLTRRDNRAKDFAGLRNQSLCLPTTSLGFLRLFVERQSEAQGKKAENYFSGISAPDNVEDALDDVVDGNVHLAVVDGVALEAYKRRKPGRFKRLKEVTRSQPFPPGIVAYYGSVLDEATLRRFKEGLLGASRKEKGRTLLTLSKLTSFEPAPDDLERILAQTRRIYPPVIPRKE